MEIIINLKKWEIVIILKVNKKKKVIIKKEMKHLSFKMR